MEVRLDIHNLDSWVCNFFSNKEQQTTATVICLSGEVGAGKTTFTQSIARCLGVGEPITSPTFLIQKEYDINNHAWIQKLIHIDAYRLNNKEELEYLGWNKIIHNPHTCIIVEWPEMVSGISFPDNTTFISLTINDDYSRTLHIKKQP